MSVAYERKTPEWIHERREGALKGALSFSTEKSGLSVECAKIEAIFLVAEQLAELNQKLEPLNLVRAIERIQAEIDKSDGTEIR